MTTHYQALVRDAADAQELRARYDDDDWCDEATRAHRRAFVLNTVLSYASDIDEQLVKDRRDMWTPVLKGLLGQVVYVDVTWCRYKNGNGHFLVAWCVKDPVEGWDYILPTEDTDLWSQAVMTPDDFAGFVTCLTQR